MSNFNDRSSTMAFLHTRRSARARNLVAPGPSETELQQILQAAIRVPDHGKQTPWRFIVIEDRQALADLISNSYKAVKGEIRPMEQQAFQNFSSNAPTLIVVLFCPRESKIPVFEQELSVGSAIQNLLIAAGVSGYDVNWLTSEAAYLDGVPAGLGFPEGKVAGFIFIGTNNEPLEERARPEWDKVISHWPKQ